MPVFWALIAFWHFCAAAASVDTSAFLHCMFGTQCVVTSSMHVLEHAAVSGAADVCFCTTAVLCVDCGEREGAVLSLEEQPVSGVSGNTLGAWLAETRASTSLGAAHPPASVRVRRWELMETACKSVLPVHDHQGMLGAANHPACTSLTIAVM